MASPLIKSFSIFGLFGSKDVHIPFNEPVTILIGENGLGKTQTLNILYCLLMGDFLQLNEYRFDSLRLEFKAKTIEITKKEIEKINNSLMKHPVIQKFIKEYGLEEFNTVRQKYFQTKGSDQKLKERLGEVSLLWHFHYDELINFFNNHNKKISSFTGTELKIRSIETHISPSEIIYWPTYRRIEADYSFADNEEDVSLDTSQTVPSLQFGMKDVQKRFNDIQYQIGRYLKIGLAEFSKSIIDIVIDEQPLDNTILDEINPEDIDLILSRVGSLLSQSQKDAVKRIISEKKIANPLSAHLLRKLVEIYSKQKELDAATKKFRDICNAYLFDKKVVYDESAIKICIVSDITNEELPLSKLSSGEKQIVSVFARVYLAKSGQRFIVLFDEPELSLSMPWQKHLLPDIMDSGTCDFMLAVTHSPFIFDNKFDQNTVGMSAFVTPCKQ